MRFSKTLFTACITLLGCSFFFIAWGQEKSAPAGVPTDGSKDAYLGISAEQIEQMKKGEIVVLSAPSDYLGLRLITAAMILDKNIDEVWALLTQPWRQEEYIPGLHSSALVEDWENGCLVDFKARVLVLIFDYRVRHTFEKDSYYSHWELDPDYNNNMKTASGFLRFYWIDKNHTLVRYGTLVEPRFFVPPELNEFLTRQSLPDALGSVKKWVDSGGTYRKRNYKSEEK